MIYLVGGPPRCGKTTFSKVMSKKLGIPWISTDMLEVVTMKYMTKKQWNKTHPYYVLRHKYRGNDNFYGRLPAKTILDVIKKEAVATHNAIDMAAICEITDGNNFIIEGYHVDPKLAARLIKKYGSKNIRAIFLTKFDAEKFAIDVHKSTTPNDWLLGGTKKPATFIKVGKMVSLYSEYFNESAKKYGLMVLNMDNNFNNKISEGIKLLCQK